MISRTVEYALRAVVHLAVEAPANRKTQQIAEVTKVPAAYLAKVLQSLSKANLVRSQRGVGGGVSLAADPEKMTILDVVNAVEPIPRILTCPLNLTSHCGRLCPLHQLLDDAMASMEAAFAATTLTELINNPHQLAPLCEETPLCQLEMPVEG